MTAIISIGLIIIFVIGIVYLPILLVDISYKIINKLNHTIFKEKYKNKLIYNIKEGIKFNNYKINLYKGLKEDNSTYDEFDKCAICRCCDSKFYISEGIYEQLVDEFKQTELEALRLYDIYSEKSRKENLQSRLEFIETELKDIKTRL